MSLWSSAEKFASFAGVKVPAQAAALLSGKPNTVELTLVEADALPRMSLLASRQDTFVTVAVRGSPVAEAHSTGVKLDAGGAPKFSETFVIPCDAAADILHFAVKDKALAALGQAGAMMASQFPNQEFLMDKLVGEAELPLRNLLANPTSEFWLQLTNAKGSAGRLHVRCVMSGNGVGGSTGGGGGRTNSLFAAFTGKPAVPVAPTATAGIGAGGAAPVMYLGNSATAPSLPMEQQPPVPPQRVVPTVVPQGRPLPQPLPQPQPQPQPAWWASAAAQR